VSYILVLQWPGGSGADFDQLIRIENALDGGLNANGVVNGHDFGSDEMNIFIDTDTPLEAFASAREILSGEPIWNETRAAYREADSESYSILWPEGLSEFSVA
jgi:hypothetical protein